MKEIIAALIAAAGSIVGVFVGARITRQIEEGRERTVLRQKWMDSLRERIPEIIGTAAWFYVSHFSKGASTSSDEAAKNVEEKNKVIELDFKITQVSLALDMNKKSHAELNQRMEDLRMTTFPGNGRIAEFPREAERLKEACIAVLKEA